MLIQSVVRNEAERNEKMIQQYEQLLDALPRGSLICRKGEYYYLKFRDNGKMHDVYIGKDPAVVENVRNQLEQRKHYSRMLAALKQEQKVIQKIMEGFA